VLYVRCNWAGAEKTQVTGPVKDPNEG
jgi:hypothetical protein